MTRPDATPVARLIQAGEASLEPLELEPEEIVAGSPRAALRPLGSFGEVEVGLWELTAGTVTDTETEELFVVISGAGTVTFADGEQIDLRPGSVVHLHEGEQTTWAITQTLRKVWITG